MKRGVLLGLLGGAAVLGLAGYAVSRRPNWSSRQDKIEKYAATCELDDNLPKEAQDVARFLMLNIARKAVSYDDAMKASGELERSGYKKTAYCVRRVAELRKELDDAFYAEGFKTGPFKDLGN